MKGDDEGFTIVETLTALAILAVALVTLYGAAATSLKGTAHAANIDRAILLAQSKLDEIAAQRGPLPAKSDGVFADSEIHWAITTDTVPEAAFASQKSVLQTIHLILLWRDGLRARSLSVETRHFGTWS